MATATCLDDRTTRRSVACRLRLPLGTVPVLALPGGTAPTWGSPGVDNDVCPSPPGETAQGCVVGARVSRLRLAGAAWDGVEHVLFEDWCQQFPSHRLDPTAVTWFHQGDGLGGRAGLRARASGTYALVSWSDGGAPTHDIVIAPGSNTLQADYELVG